MPHFCECGADQVLCQGCGQVKCSQGCNGDIKYVDTPVVKGWHCVRCLSGPSKVHDILRKFSREHGSPNAMMLKYPHDVDNPKNSLYAKSRAHTEAKAIEDEMSVTWQIGEHRIMINEFPAKIKKKYYTRPVGYQDYVEIWALENGQFVVYYSPTGATYLYNTWKEAVQFRQGRVDHLKASYRAWK